MTIGDNIKTIRKKKGLTQQQVGDACGMAQSTIRTYENGGANPKPATAAKIAKGLGVTPAELYGVNWIPGITDERDPEKQASMIQSIMDTPVPVDNPSKARLLAAFGKLSPKGQKEAIKRIEELSYVPEYESSVNQHKYC